MINKEKTYPVLETSRLKAYKPSLDFLAEYAAMLADKEFISCYGVYFDHEKAHQCLQNDIEHFAKYNFGAWIWCDKANGEYIGRGGLKNFILEEKNEIELSYAIKKEYWHQGIATEIAKASIEFGLDNLGLKQIICFTLPENKQSQKVMEKLEFRYEKDFLHANLLHKLYRFRIDNF